MQQRIQKQMRAISRLLKCENMHVQTCVLAIMIIIYPPVSYTPDKIQIYSRVFNLHFPQTVCLLAVLFLKLGYAHG